MFVWRASFTSSHVTGFSFKDRLFLCQKVFKTNSHAEFTKALCPFFKVLR